MLNSHVLSKHTSLAESVLNHYLTMATTFDKVLSADKDERLLPVLNVSVQRLKVLEYYYASCAGIREDSYLKSIVNEYYSEIKKFYNEILNHVFVGPACEQGLHAGTPRELA